MAEREAAADAVAAESDSIIVTGTAARRQNMKSAAPAGVTAEEAEADFESKLRSAFQSNNRKAILALVAYPLKVDFNGDVRTYRTRSEVERDFDRIFTADVRGAVLSGRPSRHLTLAPTSQDRTTKITAVRP